VTEIRLARRLPQSVVEAAWDAYDPTSQVEDPMREALAAALTALFDGEPVPRLRACRVYNHEDGSRGIRYTPATGRDVLDAALRTFEPPYPFCITPDKCAGRNSCPRERARSE